MAGALDTRAFHTPRVRAVLERMSADALAALSPLVTALSRGPGDVGLTKEELRAGKRGVGKLCEQFFALVQGRRGQAEDHPDEPSIGPALQNKWTEVQALHAKVETAANRLLSLQPPPWLNNPPVSSENKGAGDPQVLLQPRPLLCARYHQTRAMRKAPVLPLSRVAEFHRNYLAGFVARC